MQILKSPTSIVFILMAVAVVIFTGMKVLSAENFMILATAAFMHYFKRTNDDTKPQV